MIPLGYMLRKIVPPPEWMRAPHVELVYSVASCCTSKDFGDWINLWKHNGWWFFDNVEVLTEAAIALGSNDPAAFTLFYFEAFDLEYDENEKTWSAIAPTADFPVHVQPPASKRLHGFDVVTYSMNNSAECSPLSCNSLAADIPTNRYCLLDSVERARELLEAGAFDDGEPGPFRILAVYTLE